VKLPQCGFNNAGNHAEESENRTISAQARYFRPSFLPSCVTRYSSHIMRCAYLPGRPVKVTSSPGLTLSLLHPARSISDGGRISACPSSTLPLLSFTAMERTECGLAHS